MPVTLLPDLEVVMIAWAKIQPDVAAFYAGRASTRLPAEDRIEFPWLRLFRVATGGSEASEARVDVGLVQFDSFAAGSPSGDRDYATASRGARTVEAALEDLNRPGGSMRIILPDETEAILDGARIAARPSRQEEPVTGWARFRVDALVSIRNG